MEKWSEPSGPTGIKSWDHLNTNRDASQTEFGLGTLFIFIFVNVFGTYGFVTGFTVCVLNLLVLHLELPGTLCYLDVKNSQR